MIRTWEASGKNPESTPSKSSLSEFRTKVSYRFFEDTFRQALTNVDQSRKTFQGLYIYAMDGDQFDLPASEDILEYGYRGYPSSRNRETHFPKMYTVQALDLLNGLIVDFRHSKKQDEVHLARDIVGNLEKNSLTIYDRLHCGYWTFSSHMKAGNFFLVRARSEGPGVARPVREFCASKKRAQWVDWVPKPHYGRGNPSLRVRLVRVKNPRTGEALVFVTNLPDSKFSHKQIAKLYQRRWMIETSFKDITHTLKLNQWHSTKLNGILQEIFALLWLVNEMRMLMRQIEGENSADFLEDEYSKSNFKLCIMLFINHISLLFRKKLKQMHELLKFWILRTREKRRRLSRSYPRELKFRGREYVQSSLIKRRPKA